MEAAGTSEFDKAAFIAVREGLSKLGASSAYVASFSMHADDLSQWRAYGSGVGGFAIGFDSNTLSDHMISQLFWRYRVVYDHAPQRALLEGLLKDVAPFIREIKAEFTAVDRVEEVARFMAVNRLEWATAQVAMMIKHQAFEAEDEWRFAGEGDVIKAAQAGAPGTPASRVRTKHLKVRFRPSSFGVTPYIAVALDPDGSGLELAEVVIGPTPEPEVAQLGLERLLEENKIKCGQIRHSEAPYRKP
jgi:hypothetical protein